MSSIIVKHSLAWPLCLSLWKGAKVLLETEEAEDLVWTRDKIHPSSADLPWFFQKHPPGLVCNSNLFKIASFSDRLLPRYEPESGNSILCSTFNLPLYGHSSVCWYYLFMFSFFLVSLGLLGRSGFLVVTSFVRGTAPPIYYIMLYMQHICIILLWSPLQ